MSPGIIIIPDDDADLDADRSGLSPVSSHLTEKAARPALIEELTTSERREPALRMLDHALAYARRGWPVFPCKSGGEDYKKPLTINGFKDATTNEDQIRRWWHEYPNALIGAPMGPRVGALALDPDAAEEPGEPDGVAYWNALLAEHGDLPPTRCHLTPGGGKHVLFAYPSGRKVGLKEGGLRGKGIHVRGDGGYVILPPSTLDDGRSYRLADKELEWTLAPAPEWLLDVITDNPKKKTKSALLTAATTVRETLENVAIVEAMLTAIDPDVERSEWRNVVWGVVALGWKCGEAMARGWSTKGEKFDEGEFAKVWHSFKPGGIGVGTLVHIAKLHGYIGPGPTPAASAGLPSRTDTDAIFGTPLATASPDATGDIANAERLMGAFRGRWLWVEDAGLWLRFSPEAGWLAAADAEALNEAAMAAKRMRRQALEALSKAALGDVVARKALQNVDRTHRLRDLKAAVEIGRALPGIWARLSDFDADPMMLGVRNGVLDLRTGVLRTFSPDLLLSKRCPIDFDPGADCPRFRAFLRRVLPDREVRAFVRRFAGYCLTGDVSEHQWMFLHGGGHNGKSVFVETLAWLLGDYARPLVAEVLMDDPRGGRNHDPDIMDLQGRRLAFATETEEGQRLAAAKVKRMTGGDTISGRVPYAKAPRSFAPTHKLVVSGNHLPAISDTSHGTWRRIALVGFAVEIPEHERDPKLKEKIQEEGSGILNWALAGCRDWSVEGLQLPAAVKSATDDYRHDEDVLGQFLAERCEMDADAMFKVDGSELYAAFEMWCSCNGRRQVPTKHWLTRHLGARKVKLNRGTATYLGLRLIRHPNGAFPQHDGVGHS